MFVNCSESDVTNIANLKWCFHCVVSRKKCENGVVRLQIVSRGIGNFIYCQTCQEVLLLSVGLQLYLTPRHSMPKTAEDYSRGETLHSYSGKDYSKCLTKAVDRNVIDCHKIVCTDSCN